MKCPIVRKLNNYVYSTNLIDRSRGKHVRLGSNLITVHCYVIATSAFLFSALW
jgi:hypothetical protein